MPRNPKVLLTPDDVRRDTHKLTATVELLASQILNATSQLHEKVEILRGIDDEAE